MKKTLIIATFFITVISCNEVPKEDITVIDNFVLGQYLPDYGKKMDSLSIPHKRFFNQIAINSFDEILNQDNYVHMYYSKIFNFSDERNNESEHLGLLYPLMLNGTQNNIGLVVILGHTGNPDLSSNLVNYRGTVNEKYFRQDINRNMVDKIINLYTSKYGTPSDTLETKFGNFYVIEKNNILKYSDTTRISKEYIWKTEYLDITFFTGIDSYNSNFDVEHKFYQEVIWSYGKKFPAKNSLSDNEIPCYSFAYIQYELNQKAIEKLKLEKKNI